MDIVDWKVSNGRGRSLRKIFLVSTVQNGEVSKNLRLPKQEREKSIGESGKTNRYEGIDSSGLPLPPLLKLDRFLSPE